ncbi:MAG: IclR family transcriptional regulator [Pyramidobacter sp.]|nr:IclR family transcriptional regulator [Pyramidobacter sp.]
MTASQGTEPASKTLEHGLDVLLCFLGERRELSLTEIAAIVGRNTTSTYRLAQTLTEKGFLSKNPQNKKYSPGMTLKKLGDLVDGHSDLVLLVHPYLVELHREFNENVSLYVYHNFKRLCLDRIESTHPLHQTVLIGEELPLTLGGGGTALLAFLPPRVQTAVLRSEDGCAPDKLVEIRRRGYAVSYDEMGQGSIGLGTPILDANGVAVGALNLSGPVSRLTDSVVSRGIDSLIDAAKRISEELRAKSR